MNPNSVASTIYDSAYRTKKKLLDMATEASRKCVEDENSEIASDIEEVEQLLNGSDGNGPSLNSEQMVSLRNELGDLLMRRQ